MIGYAVQAILLAALIATSLTVGFMYRELRRLRGYQSQYVQVFDQTSRAAGDIGAAVRNLSGEGQAILAALGARIDEARTLAERLERLTGGTAGAAARAPAGAPAPLEAAVVAEDFGSYTPRDLAAAASAEAARLTSATRSRKAPAVETFGAELLGPELLGPEIPGPERPARTFRMAPSVKTLQPFKDRPS